MELSQILFEFEAHFTTRQHSLRHRTISRRNIDLKLNMKEVHGVIGTSEAAMSTVIGNYDTNKQ